jgi:hypothetical protein
MAPSVVSPPLEHGWTPRSGGTLAGPNPLFLGEPNPPAVGRPRHSPSEQLLKEFVHQQRIGVNVRRDLDGARSLVPEAGLDLGDPAVLAANPFTAVGLILRDAASDAKGDRTRRYQVPRIPWLEMEWGPGAPTLRGAGTAAQRALDRFARWTQVHTFIKSRSTRRSRSGSPLGSMPATELPLALESSGDLSPERAEELRKAVTAVRAGIAGQLAFLEQVESVFGNPNDQTSVSLLNVDLPSMFQGGLAPQSASQALALLEPGPGFASSSGPRLQTLGELASWTQRRLIAVGAVVRHETSDLVNGSRNVRDAYAGAWGPLVGSAVEYPGVELARKSSPLSAAQWQDLVARAALDQAGYLDSDEPAASGVSSLPASSGGSRRQWGQQAADSERRRDTGTGWPEL